MDAHLTAPTTPTTLIDGYTTDEEVIFWVRCHDRHLQNITIADNSGEKLFYVEYWSAGGVFKGSAEGP